MQQTSDKDKGNIRLVPETELKSLLEAAEAVIPEAIGLECGAFIDGPTLTRLAAELKGWRKE